MSVEEEKNLISQKIAEMRNDYITEDFCNTLHPSQYSACAGSEYECLCVLDEYIKYKEKTVETYREFAQNCTEKVLRRMKASNKSMQKHYKRMEMLETITHYIWLVLMPILIVDIILTIGKLLTMYGIIKAL